MRSRWRIGPICWRPGASSRVGPPPRSAANKVSRTCSWAATRKGEGAIDLFLQQLANGLVIGSTYAVVAIGFALAFTVLRVINFAHPDIFMVGMFAGLLPGAQWPGGAVGFPPPFRVLPVINFPHPDIFMVGMFAGLLPAAQWPALGLGLALLAGAAGSCPVRCSPARTRDVAPP